MTDEPSHAREPTAAGFSVPPQWLAACALVVLVAVTFFPVRRFEFINLDVGVHLLDNDAIRRVSWENLWTILTRPSPTSYYPVRTLSYLVDYQFWGLESRGFKFTNGLIHTSNVLLVYLLLLRLQRTPMPHRKESGEPSSAASINTDDPKAAFSKEQILASTFGAGLFAVHPVVVEPVAWVPGREELLMTLGALACFHFHLRVIACNRPYQLAATIACLAGCLSNAVGAVIPFVVTAWDLLTLGRSKWKTVLARTWALWLVGLATVLVKKLADQQNPFAIEQALPLWRNALVVPKIYWLNLKTIVWPTQLTLDYWDDVPRSVIDTQVLLGLLALVVTALVVWALRRHKQVLFGVLWFGLTLGPSSQIMPHHILRADRFLYLPLVGIAIVVAFGYRRLLQTLSPPATSDDDESAGELAPTGNRRPTSKLQFVASLAAAAVVLTLALLSSRQLQTWRSSVTVWQHCLKVSPENASALAGLADGLAEEGKFELAKPKFEQALRMAPNNPETMNSYAYRLALCNEQELRDYGRAIELAERACELVNWKSPIYRRTLSSAHMNLATTLSGAGRFEAAAKHYRAAMTSDPQYEAPIFNLALLLLDCPDEALRDPEEAVRLAEQACSSGGDNPLHLNILAEVYAGTGQQVKATATLRKAMDLAEAEGDREMLEALFLRLQQFEQAASKEEP